MAEWIEIKSSGTNEVTFRSPLAMAEWIEIKKYPTAFGQVLLSPLAMAEWIEIRCISRRIRACSVSASDGGVD